MLTSLLGVLTSAIALTDATREGYFEQVGLTFIAAVSCLPAACGTIALCTVLRGSRQLFFVWLIATLAVALPGLAIWALYVIQPVPRLREGGGQMHIFFFPILHLVAAIAIYLFVALVQFVHGNSERSADRVT